MLPIQQCALGYTNAPGECALRQPCSRSDGGDIDGRHLDVMDIRADMLALGKGKSLIKTLHNAVMCVHWLPP
jgi:hypothetical protein